MTRLLGGILYGLLQVLLLLVGIVAMSVAWLAGVAASVFNRFRAEPSLRNRA